MKNYHSLDLIEAGCDEAGRGALAGPLFAAAVILPKEFSHPHLNDSKKLTPKRREELRLIIEREAVAWAVASVPVERIDQINILNASIEGMHLALKKLTTTPQKLLIDGNQFKPYGEIPHLTIVGGDGKFAAIAAASILAKVYRDKEMARLATLHPQYGWERNRGYPTKEHKESIQSHGITPHHRNSFKLI